jgi:sterol desaturase/sphingolipid hydroxylase (fatty acid hydroxylase superfamily)
VPTEMLIRDEQRTSQAPSTATPTPPDELRIAARTQVERVRRLKVNAAVWTLGTVLLTTLWVLNQWNANGAFESFGHEGEPGQWNPTLWALAVGIWGLVVGMMALRVHFERPATEAEVDREVDRLPQDLADVKVRRLARARLERIHRVKFHVAAWVLGMLVLTPLWALIEWQDNGGFERWSDNSRPGDWDPWILTVGGIWALVVVILAARVAGERRTTEADIDRELQRIASGGNSRGQR